MTRSLLHARRLWLRAALTLIPSLTALGAGGAAAARAAGRSCVSLSQTSYVAHEDQGDLQITIERTNTSDQEQIRYGVRHLDSEPGLDRLELASMSVIPCDRGRFLRDSAR